MATTLLHAGKAITPKGEIPSAGILIRDGEIEAVGPRSTMRTCPPAPRKFMQQTAPRFRASWMCTFTAQAAAT